MRIIVNDTSCLIDLRKAGLLHAALLLPFRFQIALPLVHTELLDFTPADFSDLETRGLEIVDLTSKQVERVMAFRAAHAGLSLNDCLSMVLAQSQKGAILLTGDRNLRSRATAVGIEVHGVLWVSDQLETGGHVTFQALVDGLYTLQNDPVVFLPDNEIDERIRRLRGKLGHHR